MPERQSLRSQLILGYHSTLGAIVYDLLEVCADALTLTLK